MKKYYYYVTFDTGEGDANFKSGCDEVCLNEPITRFEQIYRLSMDFLEAHSHWTSCLVTNYILLRVEGE